MHEIQKWLQRKADPNAEIIVANVFAYTPLTQALSHPDSIGVIKQLLGYGVNPNVTVTNPITGQQYRDLKGIPQDITKAASIFEILLRGGMKPELSQKEMDQLSPQVIQGFDRALKKRKEWPSKAKAAILEAQPKMPEDLASLIIDYHKPQFIEDNQS